MDNKLLIYILTEQNIIYKEALSRISSGNVCISYEYDATPTEKEIAITALVEAEKLIQKS